MTAGGCASGRDHASLADELREYAGGALDLLEPLVDRIRAHPEGGSTPAEPASCAACPVCALITVLRGERSELAVRLAEHASGLLAVLRAALDEGAGADTAAHRHGAPGQSADGDTSSASGAASSRRPRPSPGPHSARQPGQPRVQRIQISRDGGRARPLYPVRSSAESC